METQQPASLQLICQLQFVWSGLWVWCGFSCRKLTNETNALCSYLSSLRSRSNLCATWHKFLPFSHAIYTVCKSTARNLREGSVELQRLWHSNFHLKTSAGELCYYPIPKQNKKSGAHWIMTCYSVTSKTNAVAGHQSQFQWFKVKMSLSVWVNCLFHRRVTL